MVLAGLDHEPVIFGGQGWVDAPCLVSGHEQRLAQHRVTALGAPAVPAGQAGGVPGSAPGR